MISTARLSALFFLALLLDAAFGEPEVIWKRIPHPAVLFGRLIGWAEGLGQATFTGSSGRVFPRAMKASPLLRRWLAAVRALPGYVGMPGMHDGA